MTLISSPSFGSRVQTSPDDKMLKLAAKLDGIDIRISEQIEKEQTLIETIRQEIDALPNEQHRDVLALRYVDCIRWEAIAERMGYTERRVYQLHGNALARFKECYPQHFI